MKFLSTFLMGASLVCGEENMREFEVLKQLETCFDVMSPAFEKSDRAFVWFSDIPHFLFNAVTHLSTDDTASAVDELIAASPGESLSFWVHPYSKSEGLAEILKARGFALAIVCPLMSWQAEPVEASDFDIRPADRDWEDFMEISSLGFELHGIVKEKYSDILQKIPSENYLVYCEGKPAGVGILLPTGSNGGIFNVAVHPEFRNRGLARGMMKFLMNRSYELGLEELVLYSAPQTEKFYQSLGFKKMFNIEIFAR